MDSSSCPVMRPRCGVTSKFRYSLSVDSKGSVFDTATLRAHVCQWMRRTRALRKPSPSLTDILAANIRAFREDKGLSQEEFADICGLHRTYVGSVERGERNVTLSTLEVFASVMGVSVPQLLTEKALRK